MAVAPALGVRAVALRVDPRVPVAERGCRRVFRHLAGERVDREGLVEVAVDGQPTSCHRRPRRRPRPRRDRARWPRRARPGPNTPRRARAPAAGEQQRAALVDALEARLRVRDRLDRRPPGVADGSIGRRDRQPDLVVAGCEPLDASAARPPSWAVRRPPTSARPTGSPRRPAASLPTRRRAGAASRSAERFSTSTSTARRGSAGRRPSRSSCGCPTGRPPRRRPGMTPARRQLSATRRRRARRPVSRPRPPPGLRCRIRGQEPDEPGTSLVGVVAELLRGAPSCLPDDVVDRGGARPSATAPCAAPALRPLAPRAAEHLVVRLRPTAHDRGQRVRRPRRSQRAIPPPSSSLTVTNWPARRGDLLAPVEVDVARGPARRAPGPSARSSAAIRCASAASRMSGDVDPAEQPVPVAVVRLAREEVIPGDVAGAARRHRRDLVAGPEHLLVDVVDLAVPDLEVAPDRAAQPAGLGPALGSRPPEGSCRRRAPRRPEAPTRPSRHTSRSGGTPARPVVAARPVRRRHGREPVARSRRAPRRTARPSARSPQQCSHVVGHAPNFSPSSPIVPSRSPASVACSRR